MIYKEILKHIYSSPFFFITQEKANLSNHLNKNVNNKINKKY